MTPHIGDIVKSKVRVMSTEADAIEAGDTGRIIDYADGTFIVTLDKPVWGYHGKIDFVRVFDENLNYFWEKA